MIEAKKRELNQQLAELDDGSDEQSSTFEGNYYSLLQIIGDMMTQSSRFLGPKCKSTLRLL